MIIDGLDFYTVKAQNRDFEEAKAFIKASCEKHYGGVFLREPLKKIQVAGTNGKGSTSAMLASILRSAGYKVGLNISPSLVRANERISINGELISDEELSRYIEPITSAMTDCGREFGGFERITAAANLWFLDENVDFAVMETGLGGRFDTVSAVEKLILASIASIGLDHVKMLGNTIEAVAMEKCGIMRDGVPTIIHPQTDAANSVIYQCADELNSEIFRVSDCTIVPICGDNSGQEFTVCVGESKYNVFIPLVGAYQMQNAANALLCALKLREMGVKISDAAIENGFRETVWHGRLQRTRIKNIKADVTVDGAHNPHAMTALKTTLKALYPNKKHTILLSVMEDKDIDGMLDIMQSFAKDVVCVKVNTRAKDAEELSNMVKLRGLNAYFADSVTEGLKLADKLCDGEILVIGSLYLVGAVLKSEE